MSTGRPHHYGHLLQIKKNLFNLILYTSFHDLINVYSCRSGADNPRGQNFDVNRNLLSLQSFVTSFKKISLKSDFILFFMVFYMYIAPGQGKAPRQGLTNPRGRNFDVNSNIFLLRLFVASFKKSLWSDFIQSFSWFIHVYSPRAGEDSPEGTKFWCQLNCLVTSLICCKFKKMSLKSDFIHFFFFFFFMI